MLLQPLWTRWSWGDGAFPVPKEMGRTWKSLFLLQLNLPHGESGQGGLPAVKIWLWVQIFKPFPSSPVPSFKDGSEMDI